MKIVRQRMCTVLYLPAALRKFNIKEQPPRVYTVIEDFLDKRHMAIANGFVKVVDAMLS